MSSLIDRRSGLTLFRGFASPANARDPELTLFVEAFTEQRAVERMAQALMSLRGCTYEVATECLYSVYSVSELTIQGFSTDRELRIFETGCNRETIDYCQDPIFLVRDPGPLTRKWAQIPMAVKAPDLVSP